MPHYLEVNSAPTEEEESNITLMSKWQFDFLVFGIHCFYGFMLHILENVKTQSWAKNTQIDIYKFEKYGQSH